MSLILTGSYDVTSCSSMEPVWVHPTSYFSTSTSEGNHMPSLISTNIKIRCSTFS